jgi:hypothetical protein
VNEARDAFERAAAPVRSHPGVSDGTGFGSSAGLRIRGKIFAFVSRDGDLVVKLPRAVVDKLVDNGHAQRFDPGHGRRMNEWAAIGLEHRRTWARRIGEAKVFVDAAARGKAASR